MVDVNERAGRVRRRGRERRSGNTHWDIGGAQGGSFASPDGALPGGASRGDVFQGDAHMGDGGGALPDMDARDAAGQSAGALSGEAEVPVVRARAGAHHLFWCVLLIAGLAGAGAYWLGVLTPPFYNVLVGVLGVLVAFVFGFAPIFRWLAAHIRVTSKRVVVSNGIIRRRVREIYLNQVLSVSASYGPLQRMRGTGDLRLDLAGGGGVTLVNVAGCRELAAAVSELVAATRG